MMQHVLMLIMWVDQLVSSVSETIIVQNETFQG